MIHNYLIISYYYYYLEKECGIPWSVFHLLLNSISIELNLASPWLETKATHSKVFQVGYSTWRTQHMIIRYNCMNICMNMNAWLENRVTEISRGYCSCWCQIYCGECFFYAALPILASCLLLLPIMIYVSAITAWPLLAPSSLFIHSKDDDKTKDTLSSILFTSYSTTLKRKLSSTTLTTNK